MLTVKDFLTCHLMLEDSQVLYEVYGEAHIMPMREFLLLFGEEICTDTGKFGKGCSIVYAGDNRESESRSGTLSFMILIMGIAAVIISVMLMLNK